MATALSFAALYLGINGDSEILILPFAWCPIHISWVWLKLVSVLHLWELELMLTEQGQQALLGMKQEESSSFYRIDATPGRRYLCLSPRGGQIQKGPSATLCIPLKQRSCDGRYTELLPSLGWV